MARVATEAAPGSLMSEFDSNQTDSVSYSNGGFKPSASCARSPWEHHHYASSNEPDSPPVDNVTGWIIRGSTPPTVVQKDVSAYHDYKRLDSEPAARRLADAFCSLQVPL